MLISKIGLKNFRNYDALDLEPAEGVNIFYGDNGAGKTNILEAIYLVSTGKSLRAVKEKEMIRFGEDESHLRVLIDKKDRISRIDMHLKKSVRRGIAINAVPIRRISELIGIANIVSFSPEDLNIIKSGPAERRRFLDLSLCQLNKIYTHRLISYNRVVNQKNKLLKNYMFEEGGRDFLDVYDEQLLSYGSEIIALRRDFIERLDSLVRGIYRRISDDREELRLVYDADTDEERFARDLKRRRSSEIKNMVSLTGPHRDDIIFLLDGRDLRHFGSQGQQRTAVISLKLAEIETVRCLGGDSPVLLLDDVLSELDRSRQNTLLSSIGSIQTFITCTGLDDFVDNRFHMDRVFNVKEGKIYDV